MDTIKFELDSCTDTPPAPQTVKYLGKDAGGGEPVLLEVVLRDPGWGPWRRAWREIAAAQKDGTGVHPDAIMIAAVVQSWSKPEPPTAGWIESLHPLVFNDLAERALAIFTVKAEQAKNSGAPLT